MIPTGTPIILETLIDRGQSDVLTEIRKAEIGLTVRHPLAVAG
jgi:hypothetical protein